MFGTILITITTLMHAYVFWRAASVPFVDQHIYKKVLILSSKLTNFFWMGKTTYFYVYIVNSLKDLNRFYTGFSEDLENHTPLSSNHGNLFLTPHLEIAQKRFLLRNT